MFELRGGHSGKSSGGVTQRKQEAGHFLGVHLAFVEIVMKAERDDPSFTEIATEFALPERQRPELIRQFGLLAAGEKLRAIFEPFGKLRTKIPQRELKRH